MPIRDYDPPRAIVIDDNTSVQNGHYVELASLLLQAAATTGYQPILAGHRDFVGSELLPQKCEIFPAFHTRRMTRWSCGFDGQSKFPRNLDAQPLRVTCSTRCHMAKDEWLTRHQWRPSEMLKCWSDGLIEVVEALQPTEKDLLIFQTADDFMMLAMARALSNRPLPRLQIKAVFHYSVYGAKDEPQEARTHFDQQLNHALARLSNHQVDLFATTEGLADQMNSGALIQKVQPIPYPIRLPATERAPRKGPPRLVIGGVHRIEQGRGTLGEFLEAIFEKHIASGDIALTLRLCPKNWRRIIPRSLHEHFQFAFELQESRLKTDPEAIDVSSQKPHIDIQPMTLPESQYYEMLESADLGVLLYDADRYQVRCSGILLEFLSRGIPVIVAENSWLANRVQYYGVPYPVGYVYNKASDFDGVLTRFLIDRPTMTRAAQSAAAIIKADHCAGATFSKLIHAKATN
jgi:hypothetical protein